MDNFKNHIDKLVSKVLNEEIENKVKQITETMSGEWTEIEVKEGDDFENVLEMVRGISQLNMEVCCTLGMITESQSKRLAEAGLHYYNHNLDTSPEYYEKIITTRTYDDRLETLQRVQNAI